MKSFEGLLLLFTLTFLAHLSTNVKTPLLNVIASVCIVCCMSTYLHTYGRLEKITSMFPHYMTIRNGKLHNSLVRVHFGNLRLNLGDLRNSPGPLRKSSEAFGSTSETFGILWVNFGNPRKSSGQLQKEGKGTGRQISHLPIFYLPPP